MNRQQRRALNRATAARSTGPVTEAGKQISSANSTTHGLTSLKPYRPSEEADYRAFEQTQIRIFAPRGDAELDLVRTIIDLKWRLNRIAVLEACLYDELEIDPHRATRSLDILGRYEHRLRRTLKETVADLQERTQTRRNLEQPEGLPAEKSKVGFVLHEKEIHGVDQPHTVPDEPLEARQNEKQPGSKAAGA